MRRDVSLRRGPVIRTRVGLLLACAIAVTSLPACNAFLDDFVYADADAAGTRADASLTTDAGAASNADAALDTGVTLDATSDDAADGGGGSTAYRDAVLAAGPVAYWRFGEGQGRNAYSQTGSGLYTADYLGGITLSVPGAIDGDLDTAIALDGTFGVVRLNQGFAAIDQQIFAIELWMRPSSAAMNAYQFLVKSLGPETELYFFYLEANGSSLHGQEANGNGVVDDEATSDPLVSTWNYVVLQSDGLQLSLYLNLALVAQAPAPLPSDAGADAGTTQFDMGGDENTYGTFEGALDELAVYPGPLRAATMALHYKLAGTHAAGDGGS